MSLNFFDSLQNFEAPYPHAVSPKALNSDDAEKILHWFETSAPWKLVEESFYEQYEFSLRDVTPPSDIAPLFSKESLRYLTLLVEKWFCASLSDKVDVTAHKLVAGQTIRIHNDFIPGQETHRVLIQFNRGWKDENGGMLMLFGSMNPTDIKQVFRPIHNSGVAFEISKKSLHAVSTIHGGERFTLVFSFFEK